MISTTEAAPDRMQVTGARTQLAALVNRVAFGGARVRLHRHGQDLAALVPIDDIARLEAQEAMAPAGMTEPGLQLLRDYDPTVHAVHRALALLAGPGGEFTGTMDLLAAETGLNKSTVRDKLGWLKDHGFVAEMTDHALRSGRRLRLLRPPF